MSRRTNQEYYLELQGKGLPVLLRESGKIYCKKCKRRVRQTTNRSLGNCKHMEIKRGVH